MVIPANISMVYLASLFYKAFSINFESLILATIVLLALILILTRHRASKNLRTKLFQTQEQHSLIKPSEHWGKAKEKIENLLREITEYRQVCEPANHQTQNSSSINKLIIQYENPRHNKNNQIYIEQTEQAEHLKDSNPPLDIQELQDISTLAKRLQARNRHRISRI
jgi:hypothetical protein